MPAASCLVSRLGWGGVPGTLSQAKLKGRCTLAPDPASAAPARPPSHGAGLIQSILGGGSGGSGSGGAPNLGPLISAALGDKEAASALPDVLGLLGKLGIGLPGLPGAQQQA